MASDKMYRQFPELRKCNVLSFHVCFFVFFKYFFGGGVMQVVAEYNSLIACSIFYVSCFCVYANFSRIVCYKMFQ